MMNKTQQRRNLPAQPGNDWHWAAYLLLAIAYVVSGKLGLMLALPPGYASPIFPPAGIAVAAAFIGGRKTLPWIFLGSLLLNIWVGYSAGHHVDATAFIAAATIATASMLQATAGGWLLRRAIGYPAAFDNGRDLLYFLLLAPVICLTSASLSVGGLTALGVIDAASFAVNWAAWWVGDTLGVVVMLPMVMIAAGEPRALWQSRARTVAIPVLLVFALFVLVFIQTNKWEHEDSLMEFRQLSQQVANQAQAKLEEQESLLEQTAGLFSHDKSGRVTREGFHRFVESMLMRFQMLQAVEWAPLVDAMHRSSFEAAQRKELPDFEIRERNSAGSLQRAGERPQFYPVTYIEPLKDNEAAVGFDLASTPERHAALSDAIGREKVVAIPPTRLIQEQQKQAGMLLLLPVKAGGNVSGVVLTVLRMDDFMNKLLPATRSMLYVRLIDVGERKTLHDSFAPGNQALYEHSFNFGMRHYQLQTAPAPAYTMQHKSWQSWGVLAVSTLGAGLLCASLLLCTGYNARIAGQIEGRTWELEKSESPLRKAPEHVPAGMGAGQPGERSLLETVLLLGLAFLAGQIVFLEWFHNIFAMMAKGYWIFLMVVWIAVRLGMREVVIALAMAASQALLGAYLKIGFFADDIARTHLVNYWFYIGALSVVGLMLSWYMNERRQAGEALAESEKRYKLLVESSPFCIHEIGLDGNFQSMNRAGLDMLGLDDVKKICGIPYLSTVSQQDSGRIGALMQDAITGTASHFEFVSAGDSLRHFKSCFIPIQDNHGKAIKLMGITEDITEHELAGRNLRSSKQLLNSIIENIPNMVFLKRASDLRFELFNRAGEDLLGHSRNELLGHNDYDFFPKEQADFFTGKDREVFKQGGVVDIPEELIDTPNGTRILHTKKMALRDEQGRPQFLLGISEDITERRKAEKELRDNKEILERIFETTHFHVVLLDPECNFIRVNKAYADACGFEPGYFPGKNHFTLYPSEELESKFRRVVETGIPYTVYSRPFEWPDKPELGTTYWDLAAYPVKGASGKVEGILFTLLEVTGRTRAEEKLRTLSTAIEQSPASVVITGLDASIQYVNPAFTRVTGYTFAEAIGQNPRILQSGQAPRETYADLWGKLTSGQEWHGEFLNKRKNGELYWEDVHIAPVKDPEGIATHYVAVKVDITGHKAAEQKLRKSEASLRAILDNVPYLIWLKDVDGRFAAVNKAFFRTTGLAQTRDVLGKTDLDLWPKELAEKYRADDAEVLGTRQQKLTEEKSIMENGEIHWVETFKAPIMDEKGRLLGTTGFARDITEHKRYIEGLRKAQELAEEIAAAKSGFLANMSHEIRTPMNAIIGLSRLALNKQSPPEVRGYLEKILNSSNNLLDILNDILDLSKAEAGRLAIVHASFDLDTVLENLDSLFAVPAEDKHLDFSIEVAPDVPRDLIGDTLHLQQVLSNLLGNAIKFTEHGKVALKISVKEFADGQATLRFSVEDTGIGIAQEDISKLFHPFTQVDHSISRRFGGTGLGLAISHELLKLMGSDFGVESTPGKGTVFSFELTLDITPEIDRRKNKSKREAGALSSELRDHSQLLAGAHILVAEDDNVNQQVVREFLELAGLEIALACNGREALEALEKNTFDAVLMDVHMPVMDGIEATRQIRAQSRFAELPIIALTADIAGEDRERYLAGGMNDFVAKPIEPMELVAALNRWMKHGERVATPDGASHTAQHSPDPVLGAAEGFDLSNILGMLNGNQQQVIELLLTFLDNTANTPAEIEAKLAAGDFQAAWELTHKLKGTAGNLGAKSLYAAARQLEGELKAGQFNPATFAAFREEFRRAMSAIAGLRQDRFPEQSASLKSGGREGEREGQSPVPEALRKAALTLDALLEENDYVTDELLDELKASLPPAKLEQFALLHGCIRNIRYAEVRQVLRTLVELLGMKESR